MPDDPSERPPEPPIVRIAGLFVRRGWATDLPTRVTAPLRRMAPERWQDRLAELLPVLVRAKLDVERMGADETARWALLVHVVAVLAGTEGAPAHAAGRPTGAALLAAGFSEARLAKLLSARGPALRDQVTQAARLLAAKGAAPLDLRPIADLVLADGSSRPSDHDIAEKARLRIASAYFAAADRAAADPLPPRSPEPA